MIIILDFGSQYTQLIARRLRELEVFCEILPCSASPQEIFGRKPAGLVLSGGPASVYDHKSPKPHPEVFRRDVPILGICYGMQLLSLVSGGVVARALRREYGPAQLEVTEEVPLFEGLPRRMPVWMSHGDGVKSLNHGFRCAARTDTAALAAIVNPEKRWYGVQFHPEVAHTPQGPRILENFVRRVCGFQERWTMGRFLKESVAAIRQQIGTDRALCALSGGVDSSVAAALAHRAVGDRLVSIFVDHGLQRHGETARIQDVFVRGLNMNVVLLDARRRFLARLRGVADPERKRKIIGREFIAVFERQSRKIKGARFLVQGTLYPDVIESASVLGPSATIKTHHNVGGLPKGMRLKLVEPLRFLFKDEVRRLGRDLGLPEEVLQRHPFPGPGLAVRVLGPVTEARLDLARRADRIVEQEMRASGYYNRVWQAFAVLLPVQTVGVMGDERTYEQAAAVRIVESQDAMTADWARIPHEILGRISNRIVSEVRGINRVVYDITPKPPGTIEWE